MVKTRSENCWSVLTYYTISKKEKYSIFAIGKNLFVFLIHLWQGSANVLAGGQHQIAGMMQRP